MRLALVIALILGPAAVWAQAPVPKAGRPMKMVRPKGKAAKQTAVKQQLDRLSEMSAEERSAALARLPAERRAQLERRLEQYNRLSPEQRKRLFSAAEGLTPEQRRAAQIGMKAFEQLPVERRPIVRQELIRLRRMNVEEREARMNSEVFQSRYTAGEQKVLREVTGALEEIE
ncbi:MAG: DUF3106 domain-containing protein [Acidobacteria bacterium]|nr:DUF3106 domain-containing protein [Acidobacteriota bacterium]